MSKKVLIATEKPFAPAARDAAAKILSEAGYQAKVLEKYPDRETLAKAVAEADALIVRSDQVPCDLLESSPNLKIVVRAGAGYDNIDCGGAKERGVVVMNTPGQNSNAVAELVFGLMIMIGRGKYSGKSGVELRGKRLGIAGLGYVGRRVAEIARGFEMKVSAFDPWVPKEKMEELGCRPAGTLEQLFSDNDFVSLHIPSCPETESSIDYSLMTRMDKGAALINTARADIINEDDLLRVFEERPDFRYAADVAPSNRDLIIDKFGDRAFFTTKKMGAQTAEANYNAAVAAARQIIAFFEEGNTCFQVNP